MRTRSLARRRRHWPLRPNASRCGGRALRASKPARSWPHHAYVHKTSTPALLADAGIVACYDEVDFRARPTFTKPFYGLRLNTIPDHENLYHGGPNAAVDGWHAVHPSRAVCAVSRSGRSCAHRRGVTTILAHPLCMKVADDRETFDTLFTGLAVNPSLFANEAEGSRAERIAGHSDVSSALTPSPRSAQSRSPSPRRFRTRHTDKAAARE